MHAQGWIENSLQICTLMIPKNGLSSVCFRVISGIKIISTLSTCVWKIPSVMLNSGNWSKVKLQMKNSHTTNKVC